MNKEKTVYIFETHKGLWFEDGVFKKELTSGKYKIPRHFDLFFIRKPKIEIRQVDIRERDLTIKGQEILTSDKVAIRVSIIVQFKVTAPKLALLAVENFDERLYSDVQLAARRSLASMKLEEILTNRNRLSEDILSEVKEKANNYGVTIMRADVKDLIFPGDVQEIMNKVLKAERLSQAQMVEAKSRVEIQLLDAKSLMEREILNSQTQARINEISSESQAKIKQTLTASEIKAEKEKAMSEREIIGQEKESAELMQKYPSILRLRELEAIKEMSKNTNARLYFGFDKYMADKIKE